MRGPPPRPPRPASRSQIQGFLHLNQNGRRPWGAAPRTVQTPKMGWRPLLDCKAGQAIAPPHPNRPCCSRGGQGGTSQLRSTLWGPSCVKSATFALAYVFFSTNCSVNFIPQPATRISAPSSVSLVSLPGPGKNRQSIPVPEESVWLWGDPRRSQEGAPVPEVAIPGPCLSPSGILPASFPSCHSSSTPFPFPSLSFSFLSSHLQGPCPGYPRNRALETKTRPRQLKSSATN